MTSKLAQLQQERAKAMRAVSFRTVAELKHEVDSAPPEEHDLEEIDFTMIEKKLLSQTQNYSAGAILREERPQPSSSSTSTSSTTTTTATTTTGPSLSSSTSTTSTNKVVAPSGVVNNNKSTTTKRKPGVPAPLVRSATNIGGPGAARRYTSSSKLVSNQKSALLAYKRSLLAAVEKGDRSLPIFNIPELDPRLSTESLPIIESVEDLTDDQSSVRSSSSTPSDQLFASFAATNSARDCNRSLIVQQVLCVRFVLMMTHNLYRRSRHVW